MKLPTTERLKDLTDSRYMDSITCLEGKALAQYALAVQALPIYAESDYGMEQCDREDLIPKANYIPRDTNAVYVRLDELDAIAGSE